MYTKYNFLIYEKSNIVLSTRLHLEIICLTIIFYEGGDFLRIIAIALFSLGFCDSI